MLKCPNCQSRTGIQKLYVGFVPVDDAVPDYVQDNRAEFIGNHTAPRELYLCSECGEGDDAAVFEALDILEANVRFEAAE